MVFDAFVNLCQVNGLEQNVWLQLVGYYTGALGVDYRYSGRRKLRVFSFTMVSPLSTSVCCIHLQ